MNLSNEVGKLIDRYLRPSTCLECGHRLPQEHNYALVSAIVELFERWKEVDCERCLDVDERWKVNDD